MLLKMLIWEISKMTKETVRGLLTIDDFELLKYLLESKVASRKQINLDIYSKHKPQSVRYRLKRLRRLGFLSTYRPYPNRSDQSNIYGLTSNGLKYIVNELNVPLLRKRLLSDSVEHDLDLVDIRRFFKSQVYVQSYYSENQIHNEVRFNEDENLKVYNQLKFDALIHYTKDSVNKVFIPIQYEKTSKSKKRYKQIISQYYFEPSLPMIIYITKSEQIKNLIGEIEDEFQKDHDIRKIFYGTLSDLSSDSKLVKFISQNNKAIVMK
ncbi:MAG: hypothetical protein CMK92_06515 [Pseudomonas sp.]|nr:hypothetical protein [Pseudomonas sp.]